MASTYRGWDKDKMQQTGGNWREPSIPNLPSFTPIDQRRNQLPTITPQRTLQANGLDNDYLYDLHEDAPEIALVQSRKRPTASRGRKISFPNGGDCEDLGGMIHHNNGANLEESPPKRKKVATSKRSQSLKTRAMAFEKAWENIEEDQYSQQEALGSHLSTPAKSGKRSKSMGPSKGNPKFKPPFRNTKITKPSSARGKEVAQVSDTPISYQGFTTTEEAVFLSKTTLEKLSTFRYKPSTVPAMPLSPVPVDHLTESEKQPLIGNQQACETPLLDDETTPNSDSFFKEATWHTINNIVCQKSDKVDHDGCSSSVLSTEKQYSHGERPLSLPIHAFSKQVSVPFEVHGHLCAFPVTEVLGNPVQTGNHSHHEDSYDDQTSNEEMLLDNLLNGMAVDVNIDHSNGAYVDENDVLRSPRVQLKAAINYVCNRITSGKLFQVEEVGEHLEPHKSHEFEEPVCSAIASGGKKDVLALLETEDFTRSKAMANSGYRIEIERLDLDEDELMLDVSRDFYGSDEFDEGLDDEDLLAVISDVVIPETPLKHHSVHDDHTPEPQVSSSPAQVEQIRTAKNRSGVAARINSSKTPTPRIFCSKPDDDYFMDEEDEDEMLKLSGCYQNFVENFIPPASVQKGISNHNVPDIEEYDSHLLFSPATSPAKMAVGNNTDSHSASQSPQGQSNVNISPVLEEEDWSFMRANDDFQDRAAQMMSDLFTEPLSAIPERRIIDITSSSPAKHTVSIISKAQTYTTQTTATSAYTVLDLDDSHEYEPIANPFARPPFAALILDRSPVIGLSSQTFLRTCFRIGEIFHAGAKCHALGLNAVVELFARVNYSRRELGTTKQHFQFLDLWVDRPPTPNGILASFKTGGLAENESRVFIDCHDKKLARVLGRLQRDPKRRDSPWMLDIINIRETDWEEIRWTRRIVSGDDLVKKERDMRMSKL